MTKSMGKSYDVGSPFSEENGSIFVDMTKHTNLNNPEDEVVRVELRRVKEAVVEGGPETRTVEVGFIIGLIGTSALPREGEAFKMSYHALNTDYIFGAGSVQDYGHIDTNTAVKDLVKVGESYYFETAEGSWRLKLLDIGN